MNIAASIPTPGPARARRGRLAPPTEAVAPKPAAPIAATIIVPSSPRLVPLRLLRRATENVRHTRIDEDVASLADDIVAHGLLQGLIGYEADGLVQIVGGGRRFQALRKIEDEGLINGEFTVPVLIRDVDEAIELSLAENLQQRTMSPVDEFLAFKALMDNGTNSPGGLAKRFGFSERVVKQRLRLAELAPEILDALAGRDISIDAAMAYAATQDRKLQLEIFKSKAKKGWEQHKPRDIKYAVATKGISTSSALFKFVGEDGYTLRGGTFEDDLFNEETKERALANPGVLLSAAREMIEFQIDSLLPKLRQRPDLAPTIVGYVVASNLRVKSYGNVLPKPPAGFVAVEKWSPENAWKTIRNNKIDVHVLVGINDNGDLVVWPKTLIVPKAQKNAIDPPTESNAYNPETPLERAVRERKQGVELWSRRLAVGPFTGTPLDGRAFWPSHDYGVATKIDGVSGQIVKIDIFVSDAEIAAQVNAAEARYDQAVAERAAETAAREGAELADRQRRDELAAMDSPAVVVVVGEAWMRTAEGAYEAEGEDGFVQSWQALLANYDIEDITDTFATRDAYDAAMAAVDTSDEVTA